jgi:phenylalanyl-tRNA synthetase beta chain
MAAPARLAGHANSPPLDRRISNYVLLELGQPLHFYDLDRLSGDIVGAARHRGRKLKTLEDRSAPSTRVTC